MTSLDQALIRAFQQQGASVAIPPQPLPPESKTTPPQRADRRREPPQQEVVATSPELPSQPEPQPALSLSDVFSGVLAALEKTPPSAPTASDGPTAFESVADKVVIEPSQPKICGWPNGQMNAGKAAPLSSSTSEPRVATAAEVFGRPAGLKTEDRLRRLTPSGEHRRPTVAASQRCEARSTEPESDVVSFPSSQPVAKAATPLRVVGDSPSLESTPQPWAVDGQQWIVGSGQWEPTIAEWATASDTGADVVPFRTQPPIAEHAEPPFVKQAATSASPLPQQPAREERAPTPGLLAQNPEPLPSGPEPLATSIDFSAASPQAEASIPETPLAAKPTPAAQRTVATPAPTAESSSARQVDRFTWPRVCRRLMSRAVDEWDRLCDALLAVGERGQKVLAMAACRRGEGATTLLLCAASRLAERGIRTVLVDADVQRPRLAKRLGLQPEAGWDETCNEDGSGLDCALIESTSGGLAVLPLRDPAPHDSQKTLDWPRLAGSLERLRSHFEVVLVDLGPLENVDWATGTPRWATAADIDSLLLVCNRQITTGEQLARTQRRLTAAGMPLAGLIENFSRTDELCTNLTGD